MPTRNRLTAVVVALLCLPLVTGCFKATTVVAINADGTATLTETMGMSKQTAQQIEAMVSGMVEGMGGEAAKDKPEGGLFSEGSFQHKETNYGPGVKYLGMKRTDTDELVQATGRYSVADITKLRLASSTEPEVGDMPGRAKKPAKPFLFSLRRLPGGLSELRVKIPEDQTPPHKPGAGGPDTKPDEGEAPTEKGNAEMGEAMLQMFKDMEMNIALECGKEIVETNAMYVEGNRVTLIQFAFGKLLADAEKLAELKELNPQPQSIEELKPLMKGIEGFKFELGPEVVIKFR